MTPSPVLKRRVVVVAPGARGVEGGAVGHVERRLGLDALRQIGVGKVARAKGHCVKLAFSDGLLVQCFPHIEPFMDFTIQN